MGDFLSSGGCLLVTSILIVEDEALIAADLRARLEGMGYEVVGLAGDGEEA